ncbi:hypothetical protein [Demequina sp. NBRC 110053]|uniref:hypothetical protein n=1 Tax=Demequina sp. NBRC 110053 TaxID=1570342 RepID=UPI0009FBE486|nr:hypothetical protein [Demequina sp. NBRC 110053]
MTDPLTLDAPTLYLPTHQMMAAEASIDGVHAALRRAAMVEWVSVAAEEYREELARLERRVGELAAAVDRARIALLQARWGAQSVGQL